MIFREATDADLKTMGEKTVSRGCFDDIPDQVDYIYALEHEGELLGIGGIKLMNKTTAWGWFDLTDKALKKPLTVYGVIKKWLDNLIKDMGLLRIMAAVETDFDVAINTVEHLGFVRESLMCKWKPDKDAYLYVLIVGE